jgi:hypothetical protein
VSLTARLPKVTLFSLLPLNSRIQLVIFAAKREVQISSLEMLLTGGVMELNANYQALNIHNKNSLFVQNTFGRLS